MSRFSCLSLSHLISLTNCSFPLLPHGSEKETSRNKQLSHKTHIPTMARELRHQQVLNLMEALYADIDYASPKFTGAAQPAKGLVDPGFEPLRPSARHVQLLESHGMLNAIYLARRNHLDDVRESLQERCQSFVVQEIARPSRDRSQTSKARCCLASTPTLQHFEMRASAWMTGSGALLSNVPAATREVSNSLRNARFFD